MCAHKLDEGCFVFVGKVNHETVLISADVEDGSVIPDKVHIDSKRTLQVCRATPVAFGNDLIPGAERCLGLRIPLPKGLECFPGYLRSLWTPRSLLPLQCPQSPRQIGGAKFTVIDDGKGWSSGLRTLNFTEARCQILTTIFVLFCVE